jgi:tRNA (guanosine-2'-O-)-methyltransferase
MYFTFSNRWSSQLFMEEKDKNKLVSEHLSRFISDHKRDFVEKVLDQRTRHIAMVLEDIYQSQNASAVIRTCECMGIQDVHIIENDSKYIVNRRVLKGSYKWVDLIRHKGKLKNNTEACYEQLRANGYRIAATDPSPEGISIHDVAVDEKIAIVMGNELHGTSSFAIDHADMKVRIPMYGFTESLNISVSAAICLNALVPALRSSEVNWQLTEAEKDDIRLRWLRKMVRNAEIMEKEFLKSIA